MFQPARHPLAEWLWSRSAGGRLSRLESATDPGHPNWSEELVFQAGDTVGYGGYTQFTSQGVKLFWVRVDF